jgi:hypothetical protein
MYATGVGAWEPRYASEAAWSSMSSPSGYRAVNAALRSRRAAAPAGPHRRQAVASRSAPSP